MECGLLFLCIYIIRHNKLQFTKTIFKVRDNVRNLTFISQCLGYQFLLVTEAIKSILY